MLYDGCAYYDEDSHDLGTSAPSNVILGMYVYFAAFLDALSFVYLEKDLVG